METTDFDQVPFLRLGDQSLSLGKALRYLQLSGKLFPLLQDIIQQHIIYEEIQQRDDLAVSLAELEQAIIDFRLKSQLTDSDRFQQWLLAQGLDRDMFQSRMVLSFKLKKLMEKIAAPDLLNRFEHQRELLEQVDLLCLIATEKALIETVKDQITNTEATFDQVVQTHAASAQDAVNVLRGMTRRGQLPVDLRTAVDQATVGELVGPFELESRWCIFQVGKRQPAQLDDDVKQALQQQLFQEWLLNQTRSLSVKFMNQDMTTTIAPEPLVTASV